MLKLIFVLLVCLTGFAFAQSQSSNIEFYCYEGDCVNLATRSGVAYDSLAYDLWQLLPFCSGGQLLYYTRFLVADSCGATATDSIFGWTTKPTYPVGAKFFVGAGGAGEAPCYVFSPCGE